MDKYDFLNVISEIFEECKTEEEINSRKRQMILLITQKAELSKMYLGSGIL